MRQLHRVTAIVAGLAVLIGVIGAASGQTLEKVGEWPYGPAEAVALDTGRNLLFLGSGGGIMIVDVSAPDVSLPVLASMATPGIVKGLAYEPPYLYVADGLNGGLRIIDVATSNAPNEIGYLDTQGTALDVAVIDNVAYIADGPGGLRIVDVSDPSDPREINFYSGTDADVQAVFLEARTDPVFQRRAYVANGVSGLLVIDVTNPEAPQELGSKDTDGSAMDVMVEGEIVYLADGDNGFLIFDISTIDSIEQIGSQTEIVPALSLYAKPQDIYIASGEAGMSIANARTLGSPELLTTLDTEGTVYEVIIDFSLAYVANGESGLAIYDVTDLENINEVSRRATPSYANDLAVVGDTAYLADAAGALHILDITEPTSPTTISGFSLDAEGRAVAVAGDIAYVLEGANTLGLVNVAVTASPQRVGAYGELTDGRDVFATTTHAYVADGAGGLKIIDVSAAPGTPTSAGGLLTDGAASGVFVSGDHAFVADGEAGLFIADISDPDAPERVLSSFDTGGTAVAVAVSGSYVYVGHGDGGVSIVDISDPDIPFITGTTDGISNAADVAVSGGYFHIAARTGGLYTYFFDGDAQPEFVAQSGTGGTAEALALSSGHIFIANGKRGLAAMTFTPPGPPPAPAAQEATEVSAFRFVANWEPAEGIAFYELDVSRNVDFTDLLAGFNGVQTGETRMAVEGLQPDTTYFYRVRSIRNGEPSANSNVVTIATAPEFQQVGAWNSMPPNSRAFNIEFDPVRQTVYLTSGNAVYAIDASKPADLKGFDSLEFSKIQDIFFLEDYLFVAAEQSGLRIVNAKEPRGIFEIAQYAPEGEPQINVNRVFVDGDRAFITEIISNRISDSISVINLSPVFDEFLPSDPWRIVGYSSDIDNPNDICFFNNEWIYLTDNEGLKPFNLTESDDKHTIDKSETSVPPATAEVYKSVQVEGDDAYVVGTEGLRIMDVSIPDKPVQSGFFATMLDARAAHPIGNFVLLLDPQNLYVVDKSDPTALSEVARFTLSGQAEDMTAWGPFIYIADGENGLKVLRYRYPQTQPIAPEAEEVTDRSFIATWSPVAGATAYRLEISEFADFSELLPDSDGILVEGTNHEILGLDFSTAYYYRITPIFADEEGRPSATILVETLPSMEPGDLDGNGMVDLNDGVIALKVLAGISESELRADYPGSGADIDGDDRAGLAEALFSLQVAAGLR